MEFGLFEGSQLLDIIYGNIYLLAVAVLVLFLSVIFSRSARKKIQVGNN